MRSRRVGREGRLSLLGNVVSLASFSVLGCVDQHEGYKDVKKSAGELSMVVVASQLEISLERRKEARKRARRLRVW